MIDKAAILKDITKAETKMFFAKAVDKAYMAEKTYEPAFTYFTDPVTAGEFMRAAERNTDMKISIFGGYDGAERAMIGFFPEYTDENAESFPISAVEVSYNGKYSSKLSHRDYLGSVMGLGITRERVGDIIIKDEGAVIMAESEIADFIASSLGKVGHTKVKCRIVDINDVISDDNGTDMNITVMSMRIDAILSKGLNISRGTAAELIKSEKVFVNWKNVISSSIGIKENDIITVRGIGRIKINEIVGKTKKDRILIKICRYK